MNFIDQEYLPIKNTSKRWVYFFFYSKYFHSALKVFKETSSGYELFFFFLPAKYYKICFLRIRMETTYFNPVFWLFLIDEHNSLWTNHMLCSVIRFTFFLASLHSDGFMVWGKSWMKKILNGQYKKCFPLLSLSVPKVLTHLNTNFKRELSLSLQTCPDDT